MGEEQDDRLHSVEVYKVFLNKALLIRGEGRFYRKTPPEITFPNPIIIWDFPYHFIRYMCGSRVWYYTK